MYALNVCLIPSRFQAFTCHCYVLFKIYIQHLPLQTPSAEHEQLHEPAAATGGERDDCSESVIQHLLSRPAATRRPQCYKLVADEPGHKMFYLLQNFP